PDTLRAAGIDHADILILSSSSIPSGPDIIKEAKRINPGIRVIARTAYLKEADELMDAGATAVFSGEGEVALSITEKCFELLHMFPRVPEVVHYSFLVLTCAMFGKNERKVRQYCNTHNIDDIVAKQMEIHRYHSGVMNSIQGLRGVANMHKYLPPMTDFKYKVNFPTDINQAEPESDEEIEEDDETMGEGEGGYMLGDEPGGEK
ncbi:hypothetical protein EON65_11335, partial [archaeon]